MPFRFTIQRVHGTTVSIIDLKKAQDIFCAFFIDKFLTNLPIEQDIGLAFRRAL